ncbi:S26 family signal peptidase [Sphingosinicella sp. LHD-64]|uniref:S26 family signal peptidase n=1 Tax=Sphingosinicella sp. LHD-64 TaxID=3072139 RepID=UPI0028109A40|nr:S26 family signal peptidase [Sphingosinicella sp. LHD-64]MDQ8757468.1 S26 family signal peptidase [Sphingosinicella sp. LHD-64]
MTERARRLCQMGAAGLLALGLAATIMAPPRPRLVWNASPSAPIGLYAVVEGAPAAGDIVIAWPPASVRQLAARRHYLPANVPLVKRVAAGPGDRLCALGSGILVNGRRVARRLARDGAGRPMPWWRGCTRLRAGSWFLLVADSPASFDGRYFGPTGGRDMIGKARLLWAR